MATQIKIRRDSSANWTSSNPVLSLGEMAYETDTLKIKFGTGSANWNALPYATLGVGGGLTLTSLSVTTGTATGGGSLSYNNTTGVFTFRPANLSSYLTGITGSQVTTALGYTPIQLSSLSVNSAVANSQFSTLSYNPATGVFNFVPFQLAAATTATLGGVKVDGTTITINNGVITAVGGGGGGGGSGTVNAGLASALAFYPSNGSTVDDLSNVFWISGSNTLNVVGTVQGTNLVGAITSLQVTDALGYIPTQLSSFNIANGATSSFYSSLVYDQTSGTFTYSPFALAAASTTVLGGIKVGTGLSIDGLQKLNLSIASGSTLGGIKVGTGLAISGDGTLSSTVTAYTLPTASASVLGGIKVGTGLAIDGSGVLSSTVTGYTLPTATTSVLGGVKIDGTTITINGSGVISVVAPGLNANNLTGSTLASNVVNSSLTTLGTLSSLTVSGLATTTQRSNVLTSISNASGTVTHDFTAGNVFYHNSPNSSWITNITNVPTTNSRQLEVLLVINQGVTGYVPSGYQIDGGAQSILWEAGVAPSGTANKIDIIILTLIRRSNQWIILGRYHNNF